MSVARAAGRWGWTVLLAMGLVACGTSPRPTAGSDPFEPSSEPPVALTVQLAGAEWSAVALPGKLPTHYGVVAKEGRQALHAQSKGSASLMRHRLRRPLPEVGEVSFSWWVPHILPGGDVRHVASEDAVARVVFAFQGDVSSLPMRTRMQFELMQALTGEAPPYATLMYVFDHSAPVGTVVVNPRSDRIRKIVLDGGAEGLKRWRDHRRNLREDFIRAFGEDPGPLQAVAVMTDTDNTGSQAETWYGPVTFH